MQTDVAFFGLAFLIVFGTTPAVLLHQPDSALPPPLENVPPEQPPPLETVPPEQPPPLETVPPEQPPPLENIPPEEAPRATANEIGCKTASSSKDIEIALFGATGFLGKEFALYFAARPGLNKWAMAGRNIDSLTVVKTQLLASPSKKDGAHRADLIVADYNDYESLLKLAIRSKVILNTAGPFEKLHADKLVKAAMEGCAHYVDVSGEIHWKAKIMELFGPEAEEKGLIISQGAGFVSLAADFAALSAARDVAEDGNGHPSDVFITFLKMNGAPGGATMAATQYTETKYGILKEPYILAPEQTVAARIDKEVDGIEKYGFHPGVNMFLQSYEGSRMDCPVIRRSMYLEYPDVPIKVHEAKNRSFVSELKDFLTDQRILTDHPPIRPGSHTGPPAWIRKEGSFAYEAWALRKKDGRAARVTCTGVQDPAFRGTAKMTGEYVIALAELGPYNSKSGYRSPAQVLNTKELEKRWLAVEGGQWMTITHMMEQTSTPSKDPPEESPCSCSGEGTSAASKISSGDGLTGSCNCST